MNHSQMRQAAYNFALSKKGQWWGYDDIPKGTAGRDAPRRWREVRWLFNYKERLNSEGCKEFFIKSAKRFSRGSQLRKAA